MKINRVKNALSRMQKIGKPVVLLGATGIGKTQSVYEYASEIDMEVCYVNLINNSRTDFSFPVKVGENGDLRVKQVRNESLVPQEKCILLLDELTNAEEEELKVAMQITGERRIGSHPLHPETFIIATGNRPEDSRLATTLPKTIQERCAVYLVENDIETFAQYISEKWGEIGNAYVSFLRSSGTFEWVSPRRHEFIVQYISKFQGDFILDDLVAFSNPKFAVKLVDMLNAMFKKAMFDINHQYVDAVHYIKYVAAKNPEKYMGEVLRYKDTKHFDFIIFLDKCIDIGNENNIDMTSLRTLREVM